MAAHIITISAVVTALTLCSLGAGAAAPVPTGMPDCDTTCGNVSVPYPFGMGPSRCYHSAGFNLTCDRTADPPRLLLPGDGTLRFDRILRGFLLRVIRTGSIETDADGHGTFGGGLANDGPFMLAADPNELVVTGCNVQATLKSGNVTIASCTSLCKDTLRSDGHVTRTGRGYVWSRLDTSMLCAGEGCCQADIIVNREEVAGEPVYSTSYDVELKWIGWNRTADKEWPARVFIAAKGWFEQTWVSTELLYTNRDRPSKDAMEIPVWLTWAIAKNYSQCLTLCKSKNTNCTDNSYNGNRGYRCYCEQGYEGNPYITDGCQGKSVVMGIASGEGFILLVLAAFLVSIKFKRQRTLRLTQMFFEQNHGQLLRQLVAQRAGIAERMIISLEELEKATNNFDKTHELGGGGHGTVYKGILSNLHVVAIKKPKIVLQKEIDEFIDEVAILSQINHRNVVKLYGCYLETQVPMLVYEFISNGTLHDHLHMEGQKSLPWDDRLRIAIETTKSLAYLHSTASIPIIHRDIKSANILLDDTLTTNVAYFGASKYISLEKSGLTIMVQGTIGYLDPMYFTTGHLIEKSDVYSYGVILVPEKKPFSYMSSKGKGLAAHFSTLFVEGNFVGNMP